MRPVIEHRKNTIKAYLQDNGPTDSIILCGAMDEDSIRNEDIRDIVPTTTIYLAVLELLEEKKVILQTKNGEPAFDPWDAYIRLP